jgi:hypothetical protein
MRRSSFWVGLGCGLVGLVACATGNGGHGFQPGETDDAGSLTGGGEGGAFGDDGSNGPCVNLQCQQVDCASQGAPKTTISGVVYDPAGMRPLYNVVVYVPNAPVDPFPSGVSCDKCGTVASGSPVVAALTDASGHFVLDNAPSGDAIPLVLQIGKWRRQLTIPHVSSCTDTPMTDANTMRLPRNKGEGDMPQIALVLGEADPFECLLRKIGIDDAEFTADSGDGRVHLYQGEAINVHVPTPTIPGASPATALWSDVDKMKGYDLVINSCEGQEFGDEKPQSSLQNFVDYANAGGRSFNTHYQYYWLKDGVAPMPSTAQWTATGPIEIPGSLTGTVDTSFPKGEAFAEWLVDVGASPSKGALPITQPRFDASGVQPPSLRWIYGTNSLTSQPALLHYTFNTPVGQAADQQCGKVLFSDFHVEEPAIGLMQQYFPAECKQAQMTPQDLALEFMFFDLSSCIQEDTQPPMPPVPR